MPSSFLPARASLLKIVPTLILAFALVGCGGNGGSDESSGDTPYQVGDPLTDSTLALVVTSDYGSDTLRAMAYQRRMKRAMGRRSPRQQSGASQKLHQQFVRGFARQHVMRGEAAAQDIEADTAQISRRLQKIKARYKSEEQFRQRLAKSNLTVDSVRAMLADQLQQQALQQQMSENYEEPTDAEVTKYSKENRRIRAQHILIKVDQNSPQSRVDSARQVATTLIDSAQMEDVSFAELARRHSEGPSAKQGGDVGFFRRGRMAEPFSKAAFALADSGDVTQEPVRTRFGFHVIRLTDPGQPMDESKARQQMTQERRKKAVENQVNELLQKVTVRANPDVVNAGLYNE